MNETLVLALATGATGLLGAVIGAGSSVALERRRESRRGAALRQAVRGDVVRWLQICEYAAEHGRAVGDPTRGIRWWDIAGEMALHMPIGLYLLTFRLYGEREQIEHAYARGLEGIEDPQEAYAIRFALRKWAVLAEHSLEVWDEYESRQWWKRIWHRLQRPLLERRADSIAQLMGQIDAQVVDTLRSKYGEEVTDDGALASDVARSERHRREQEQFLAGLRPAGGVE